MPPNAPVWRQAVRAGLTAAMMTLSLPLGAQQAPERWTFALTPYLWLPNVDGALKYSAPPSASGAPSVDVGPNDYLENLSAALMLSGEARKGKWSIVSDLIYLHFASEKSRVRSVDFGGSVVASTFDVRTTSSLKGLQWMLAGGYTAVQTSRATVDVLGGLRYLGIEARTGWQLTAAVAGPGPGQVFPAAGNISERRDLWDAIIGVRGRARLGQSQWFVPYHLDLGAGSSTFTWQAMLAISRAFEWGEATLGYRHLSYDQSDDRMFQDFRFSGPALGASFRF
jgi:hypothetical protein